MSGSEIDVVDEDEAAVDSEFTRGIRALVEMADDTFEDVASTLSEIYGTFEELAIAVDAAIGDVAPSVVATVLAVRQQRDIDEGVDLLSDASGPKFLVERLRRLIRSPAIVSVSKAYRLVLDNERNFAGASSTIDIRHIFDDDLVPLPAAVVLLAFRMDHWDRRDRLRSVEVVLDREDLDSLKVAVQRAIDKFDAISAKLLAEGTTVLSPVEVHTSS